MRKIVEFMLGVLGVEVKVIGMFKGKGVEVGSFGFKGIVIVFVFFFLFRVCVSKLVCMFCGNGEFMLFRRILRW